MACPAAYEQPTIQTSWQAFRRHFSTLLLIWLVSSLISAAGLILTLVIRGSADEPLAQLAQLPFSLVAGFVGILLTAVPALHYARGQVIRPQQAFAELARRPGRYILAGLLFTLVSTLGLLLCIIPGIAVMLVMPVYVNLIFTGDRPILDAFQASFQACFGTAEGRSFVVTQLVTWLLVIVIMVCTVLVGGLVVVPMANFYLQNLAYRRGLVR